MLAGDRNIAGAWSGDTAVLKIGPDNLPGWTHELHDGQGNILFGDSHVELLNSQKLQTAAGLSKKEIPIYLPLAAPNASARAGSSHGADASAGPAIQSASAGGNQPSATASAGSASPTPVGGLDRLEMIFQDPKQRKSSLG